MKEPAYYEHQLCDQTGKVVANLSIIHVETVPTDIGGFKFGDDGLTDFSRMETNTMDQNEISFSCDGVPLSFTQMGILRGVKEQYSKHNCGMGFVQNETTNYLEEQGLVRTEDYPSRDGRLRTLYLTERSKNNDILNHVTGTSVKICG